ncbi:CoA pyrophosphatase [Qipengyuania nanhaisediminis]|uniref:CoA pyrophosphatase n=1 Tax=Qipengyuania nanhaisediminis TaxID=604088 RepID=UPI0038B2C1D9
MSALFDHLAALFEAGHAREVTGLRDDSRFARTDAPIQAAVLIAVTDRDEPGVILTQRPHSMRDHPGQVAFPGGKIEPGEDAVGAALREAEEELALPPGEVRVIGTSDLYQTGTGFSVTPVLCVVPDGLSLNPDPVEVEAWFEAPLALLLDEGSWTENEVFWRGETRRYLELDYGGYKIWGVTAAIIANLARRIPLADFARKAGSR